MPNSEPLDLREAVMKKAAERASYDPKFREAVIETVHVCWTKAEMKNMVKAIHMLINLRIPEKEAIALATEWTLYYAQAAQEAWKEMAASRDELD